jgi:arsenate reductase (thioredoxin)
MGRDPAGSRGVKTTILTLCVGNSCRSQMAAGWLRHLGGERVHVLSGGSKPGKAVAARAITVMNEVGIDISGYTPTHYSDHLGRHLDHAIAVCSESDENCYAGFPAAMSFHRLPVTDPGHHEGTEEEILQAHREVRDELKLKMETFLKEISA